LRRRCIIISSIIYTTGTIRKKGTSGCGSGSSHEEWPLLLPAWNDIKRKWRGGEPVTREKGWEGGERMERPGVGGGEERKRSGLGSIDRFDQR